MAFGRRFNAEDRVGFTLGTATGSRLFKIPVNEYRPVWGKGIFVFRALPAINPDNPAEFDPMILSDGVTLGEWCFTDLMAHYAGVDMKVSFFLCDGTSKVDLIDNPSPYTVLFGAIDSLKKREFASRDQQKWLGLLEGTAKSGPALPYYKAPHTFIQGIVYRKGEDEYEVEDSFKKPTIIHLSSSANFALKREIDVLRMSKPEADITALDQSYFITLWTGSLPHPYTKVPGDPGSKVYRGSLDETYKTYGAHHGANTILTDQEARIREHVKPWSSVINFLSYEAQADLLCRAFKSYPQMLLYAFSDYPTWISEDIRKAATATVSQTVHPATSMFKYSAEENTTVSSEAPWDTSEENSTPAPTPETVAF